MAQMMKPLCIDLFCGLGGWAEGFLAEGWQVIGFDIERHDYGTGGYPGELVFQDVLTLHGSQFKDADCIVASPPCQAYSYRAMPWKRAKALPPPDNSLFNTCFRIQCEASEAAARHIPLVVENVNGAQKWVGRATWHYGSYYLWGDVPALMPLTLNEGYSQKVPVYSDPRRNGGKGVHLTNRQENYRGCRIADLHLEETRMISRKAASAQIAKIPFPLASWIAQVYKPHMEATA